MTNITRQSCCNFGAALFWCLLDASNDCRQLFLQLLEQYLAFVARCAEPAISQFLVHFPDRFYVLLDYLQCRLNQPKQPLVFVATGCLLFKHRCVPFSGSWDTGMASPLATSEPPSPMCWLVSRWHRSFWSSRPAMPGKAIIEAMPDDRRRRAVKSDATAFPPRRRPGGLGSLIRVADDSPPAS